MKSECLPFTQIPHTTKLFEDFLSYKSAVRCFYPRSPHFREWVQQETPYQRYDQQRRQRVSDVLLRQNKSWGASPKTLENLERFRQGASVAVTGQQVGLFGGPLFSLFKALTAVKFADEATAAGVECIPVFWLATEDHDLEEVNHTVLFGAEAQLENFVTSAEGPAGAPVGSVRLGEDIDPLVEAAATLLGDSPVTQVLRESYRPGESLGTSFARLFARLFAEWGVVLLDAMDPELHVIAQPIYRGALEHAAEIDERLLKRGTELESAGYHQQVKVTPSSTLLFTLRNGARTPIHRRLNGNSEMEFLVGDDRIPRDQLLSEVTAHPDRFSPNVLLRPVVQDYLLPTLVYTGGSAEIAYFAQAGVVYQELLGHVTPVLPRFSATLIEPKSQRLLDRYELRFTDCFLPSLREVLAERTLPADLQAAFEKANVSLENSLTEIRRGLEKLDPTLVEAANRAGSKMQYQLEHLRAGAGRAELRQSELLARHSEVLSNSLYPSKSLQEREIAGIYFLARYGGELLQELYSNVHTDCLDHQVIRF